jgi:hypothetical protein
VQLTFNMKPEMIEIDPAAVDRRPTFTSSLVLCAETGGITPKELAGRIVKDEESWSRIKSPTPKQFFPQDRLIDFMDVCQNEAPLMWLARKRGYQLVPMETELERLLRIEREARVELEVENRVMRKLLGR